MSTRREALFLIAGFATTACSLDASNVDNDPRPIASPSPSPFPKKEAAPMATPTVMIAKKPLPIFPLTPEQTELFKTEMAKIDDLYKQATIPGVFQFNKGSPILFRWETEEGAANLYSPIKSWPYTSRKLISQGGILYFVQLFTGFNDNFLQEKVGRMDFIAEALISGSRNELSFKPLPQSVSVDPRFMPDVTSRIFTNVPPADQWSKSSPVDTSRLTDAFSPYGLELANTERSAVVKDSEGGVLRFSVNERSRISRWRI